MTTDKITQQVEAFCLHEYVNTAFPPRVWVNIKPQGRFNSLRAYVLLRKDNYHMDEYVSLAEHNSLMASKKCNRCGYIFYNPKTVIQDNQQRAAEWEDVAKSAEALLAAERARSAKLAEALEDIRLQHYGIKNTWCGMWRNCTKCLTTFAFGGNWQVTSGDHEKCHYCRAEQTLAEYSGGE